MKKQNRLWLIFVVPFLVVLMTLVWFLRPPVLQAKIGDILSSRHGMKLFMANTGASVQYMPLLTTSCVDYFDDFSNLNSGWLVKDDSDALFQYLNGEYRILNREAAAIFKTQAPVYGWEHYTVEVEARWAGSPTDGVYNLVFDFSDEALPYHILAVFPALKQFRILRLNPNAVVVDFTHSAAINSGTAVNHMKVIRQGDQVTVEINGATLGTWTIEPLVSLAQVGVGMAPFPVSPTPMVDARFDNFRVTCLSGAE